MKGLKVRNLYVFIYIDALPLERINEYDSPFLATLLKKGRTYLLDNIPGYSFGIQSTMFSGKLPQETKHWMPYIYIPELSERKLSKDWPLQNLLDVFRFSSSPLNYIYHFILCNSMFGMFARRRGAKLCGMPVEYLDKFYVYPYYFVNENPFFLELKETLESKYGVQTFYFGHSLREVQNSLIKLLKSSYNGKAGLKQDLLLFIYIDDLDGIGHVQGIGAGQWLERLRIIDANISYMYKQFHNLSKYVYLMVFSDHGMCNADEYINIENLFQRYDLRHSILYFVDATLALIWINNFKLKESIVKIIHRKLKGKVKVFDVESDKDTLQRFGIYFKGREYGDLIVQTTPCKEFFPNFYSVTKRLKGLHGFWPDEDVQRSFIMISSSGTGSFASHCKLVHIKDLRNFLVNLIGSSM